MLRTSINERDNHYGTYCAVKIDDMEVEQNLFVQNCESYSIIFGQLYIRAMTMKTKILDDGSHYARICSLNGKRTV